MIHTYAIEQSTCREMLANAQVTSKLLSLLCLPLQQHYLSTLNRMATVGPPSNGPIPKTGRICVAFSPSALKTQGAGLETSSISGNNVCHRVRPLKAAVFLLFLLFSLIIIFPFSCSSSSSSHKLGGRKAS